MGRPLIALALLGALALVPAGAAAAPPSDTGQELPAPSTPELIDRAQEDGEIGLERATQLRVRALGRGGDLPARFESDTPYDGTLMLLRAQRDLKRLDPGPARREVTAALRAPDDPNLASDCGGPSPVLVNHIETPHFYIQYTDGTLEPSLALSDYASALEAGWTTEVDRFGWAAPPANALAQAELGGKYHVRIEPLSPGLYGFVSSSGTYAGPVGDNPSTPWSEGDADATCMVLNSDYATGFPGAPGNALQATGAHEFNHSLQFGYGALSGENSPDPHFAEGGATWMEDEVQDASNDNYNYLYPDFESSMGEHSTGPNEEYAYWHVFRGLTERFGTGVPGGGEDVMQEFWERTSRGEPGMLSALGAALVAKGSSLASAYHDYATAAKFNAPCGGGYVLPLCFEEGQAYVDFDPEGDRPANGETQSQGAVEAVGDSYSGAVLDNYALNWIALPANASFSATLRNTSAGGLLRASVACDTGATVLRASLPTPLAPGAQGTIDGLATSGCREAVAVITNEAQTAANPSASVASSYRLSTAPLSRLTLGNVRVRPSGVALIRVRVSGPGRLMAIARSRARRPPRFRLRRFTVARRTALATGPGTVTLRLKAGTRARKVMRSRPRRRLRSRIDVVFRPEKGVRRTESKTATFRLKR